MAPGPLAALRRRRHLLGARRDGQGAGRHPRVRRAPRRPRRSCTPTVARRSSPTRRRRAGSRATCGRWSASTRRRPAAATAASEAFAAWRRFFEALAERGPLVLVFEDLHWADDALLDFVDHLVDWAVGVPLLVVCTARPELLERRPGWGGGKRNALDRLAVAALRRRDRAADRRAAASRRCCPPRRRRRCSRAPAATRCTPRSTCGCCRTAGSCAARAAAGSSTASELPLPETVQGIIAARLDALPPEEKALLQDAAVVGKVVWLGALRRSAARALAVEERAARARAQGVPAPRAPLLGGRRDAVRVLPRARPRRRLRPDPARAARREAPRSPPSGSSRSAPGGRTRRDAGAPLPAALHYARRPPAHRRSGPGPGSRCARPATAPTR